MASSHSIHILVSLAAQQSLDSGRITIPQRQLDSHRSKRAPDNQEPNEQLICKQFAQIRTESDSRRYSLTEGRARALSAVAMVTTFVNVPGYVVTDTLCVDANILNTAWSGGSGSTLVTAILNGDGSTTLHWEMELASGEIPLTEAAGYQLAQMYVQGGNCKLQLWSEGGTTQIGSTLTTACNGSRWPDAIFWGNGAGSTVSPGTIKFGKAIGCFED